MFFTLVSTQIPSSKHFFHYVKHHDDNYLDWYQNMNVYNF